MNQNGFAYAIVYFWFYLERNALIMSFPLYRMLFDVPETVSKLINYLGL